MAPTWGLRVRCLLHPGCPPPLGVAPHAGPGRQASRIAHLAGEFSQNRPSSLFPPQRVLIPDLPTNEDSRAHESRSKPAFSPGASGIQLESPLRGGHAGQSLPSILSPGPAFSRMIQQFQKEDSRAPALSAGELRAPTCRNPFLALDFAVFLLL